MLEKNGKKIKFLVANTVFILNWTIFKQQETHLK